MAGAILWAYGWQFSIIEKRDEKSGRGRYSEIDGEVEGRDETTRADREFLDDGGISFGPCRDIQRGYSIAK